MTKNEIAQDVAAKAGIPVQRSEIVVQKTMDAILESLLNERRIEAEFVVDSVKNDAA